MKNCLEKLPDNHIYYNRHFGGFFLLFQKNPYIICTDFAGGRNFNPTNPTRPRLLNVKYGDGKLCYKFS